MCPDSGLAAFSCQSTVEKSLEQQRPPPAPPRRAPKGRGARQRTNTRMALAYDPEENAGSESDSSRWAQGTAPGTSDWLVLSLVSLLYRDPGPGRAYLTDPGPGRGASNKMRAGESRMLNACARRAGGLNQAICNSDVTHGRCVPGYSISNIAACRLAFHFRWG